MAGKTFYVYSYTERNGDTPFYIGKGTGDRAWRCVRPSQRLQQPFLAKKLAKLHRLGIPVDVDILLETQDESEALDMERKYIAAYGKRCDGTGVLVNLSNGGEGPSGVIPTAGTRSRMQEGHRKRNKRCHRTLNAINPGTGAVEHQFHSAADAARFLGIRRSSLSAGVQNPHHICHGYLWWYSDSGMTFETVRAKRDALDRTTLALAATEFSKKPVESYDLDTGEIIKQYESVNAAEADGHTAVGLAHALKGRYSHHHGLGWRYTRLEDRVPPRPYRETKRPVEQTDLSTGQVVATFDTVTGAAKSVAGWPSQVVKVARGKARSYKGYGWRYAHPKPTDVGKTG